MALGTTFQFLTDSSRASQSPTGPWILAIDGGGLDDQDASTITNPTTGITLSTRKLMQRGSRGGTYVQVRAGRDRACTVSVDAVVKLFGRYNSLSAWQLLKTRTGNLSATLTTAASTDVDDGTYKYTTPDDNHTWDCQGCEEFLLGVETAFAVSAGTAANAFAQAKMF